MKLNRVQNALPYLDVVCFEVYIRYVLLARTSRGLMAGQC